MQTFEQWWNEIEGYGLRAERFTTPGEAAQAAWDQAMSLRAQADARPCEWWDEAAALHAEWTSETMPAAGTELGKRTATFIGDCIARASRTAEASARGLSDDQIESIARECEPTVTGMHPEAVVEIVRACLTRASAATVAESNTPIEKLLAHYASEECDFNDVQGMAGNALRYAETMPDSHARCLLYKLGQHVLNQSAATVAEPSNTQYVPELLTDGPDSIRQDMRSAWRDGWNSARTAVLNHKAAQQQAEPGADERWAKPISDEMMDLVDRLGSESDKVDPRAWEHLLIYAPKPPQMDVISAPIEMNNWHGRHAYAAGWNACRKARKNLAAQSGQRAGVAEDAIEAAAKKLAEDFDYPWEHMPAQGKDDFRGKVRSIAAMLTAATEAK